MSKPQITHKDFRALAKEMGADETRQHRGGNPMRMTSTAIFLIFDGNMTVHVKFRDGMLSNSIHHRFSYEYNGGLIPSLELFKQQVAQVEEFIGAVRQRGRLP